MPYRIVKRGPRNYAIVNKDTGKTVGHSTSKAKAQANINASNAGKHGWKPRRN